MSTEVPLKTLRDIAAEAAYLGGRRAMAYFNAGVAVETKADRTPVTQADRESEQVIRAHIAKHFPSHAVLGEEFGQSAGDADYRWIIDPIDGTKSFIAGTPMWGVLIGVEVRNQPAVGCIYIPVLEEMIVAARGLGCSWNGRPARVSATADLAQATLLTSNIRWCQRKSPAYDKLASSMKMDCQWGDCYGYVLVATGRAEAMVDPAINPWDCACLPPIIEEAGGQWAAWNGDRTIFGADFFATNTALHAPVAAALKNG